MQNNKKFEKPEMEKVMFEAEDVIVTSGGPTCSGNCSDVGSRACDDDIG